MKKTAFIIAMAMAVTLLFCSCAPAAGNWEGMTDKSVVAKVKDAELSYELANYHYEEQKATNVISKQLASDGSFKYDGKESGRDECLEKLLGAMALSAVAEEQGIAISSDEAKDLARQTYIVGAEKYDYLNTFKNTLLSALDIKEDQFLDLAAEELRITTNADAVGTKIYKELKEKYSDKDQLKAAIKHELEDQTADIEIVNMTTGGNGSRLKPDYTTFADETLTLNEARR